VLPGGWVPIVLLLVLLVGLVLLLRSGLVTLRRTDPLRDQRRAAALTTAAEYRAEAERLAAAGEFKEAIRARMRALARELEERAVLDPRPGRTAGEIATEGGRLVPAVRPALVTAAEGFGEVWYGGRPATADGYARLAAADDAVRGARLVVVA
jgi:hypothetical protein